MWCFHPFDNSPMAMSSRSTTVKYSQEVIADSRFIETSATNNIHHVESMCDYGVPRVCAGRPTSIYTSQPNQLGRMSQA